MGRRAFSEENVNLKSVLYKWKGIRGKEEADFQSMVEMSEDGLKLYI